MDEKDKVSSNSNNSDGITNKKLFNNFSLLNSNLLKNANKSLLSPFSRHELRNDEEQITDKSFEEIISEERKRLKNENQKTIELFKRDCIDSFEQWRNSDLEFFNEKIAILNNNNQKILDTLKQNFADQFEQIRNSESSILNKQLVNFKKDFDEIKNSYIDENNEVVKTNTKIFSDLEKNYREKLDLLVNNAKDILTDASTAVLTTSFKEEKQARFNSLRWSLAAFCFVVLIMLSVPVLLYNYGNIQIDNWATNPLLFVFSLAKAAALEWPLIWVASLLSKRMQLQQRVYEEYSHKYAAALSYSALRKDIKNLGKDCEGIANSTELKGFTERLVEAIYLNPSAVFDKKIESGSPSEGIVKIIEKLGPDGVKQALAEIGDKFVKK